MSCTSEDTDRNHESRYTERTRERVRKTEDQEDVIHRDILWESPRKVGVIKNGTELNEVPKVLTYNLENKTQDTICHIIIDLLLKSSY